MADRPSFTCPRCGRTSYHPDDIREGYCGACNDWTGQAATAAIADAAYGLREGTPMADPWNDPETRRWEAHIRHQLVPMIRGSAVTACLNPGDPDVKSAVELGYMILLDKPIAVFTLGRPMPDKLRRVADVVIDGDPSDPAARAAFVAFLEAHR